jgi:hypothetical protein
MKEMLSIRMEGKKNSCSGIKNKEGNTASNFN